MIFNYLILAVLSVVIVSILANKNKKSLRNLGLYWLVSIFLAISSLVLGLKEISYAFAGVAVFLLIFGDKLKFK